MLLLACAAAQGPSATTQYAGRIPQDTEATLETNGFTRLQNVTTEQEGADLRVKIMLSSPVKPQIKTANDPDRIVLDFPETSCSSKTKEIDANGIQRLRVAQHSATPLIARVVIDLEKSYPYTVSTQGNNVVLTVNTTERPQLLPIAALSGDSIGASRAEAEEERIALVAGRSGDLPDRAPLPMTTAPSEETTAAALPPDSTVLSKSSTAADDADSSDDDSPADDSPDPGADTSAERKKQSKQPYLNMEWTVPALNLVTGLEGNGVIYGIAASQGYGWGKDPVFGDTSGSVSILQPYAGYYNVGHRTSIEALYRPTIDLFNSGTWEGRVLQRADLKGEHIFSRHWRLYFAGRITHGPADLRYFELLSLGEPTYAVPTNIVTAGLGSIRLRWLAKPKQQISFQFTDSDASFVGGTNNTTQGRIQVENGFGHYSNWYEYAEESHYSLYPDCFRVGFGAGFNAVIAKHTVLGLEGGPQYIVGSCRLADSASFGGFFHQRLTQSTAFSLRAKRRMWDESLPQDVWIDNFAASLQQRAGNSVFLDVIASYVNGDLSGARLSPSYHGFLFGARLQWYLTNKLSLAPSYEYVKRDDTNTNLAWTSFQRRRSWVFFSLIWNSRGQRRSVFSLP